MPHLMLNEIWLAAASEWQCRADAWLLVRLSSGMGYWQQDNNGYQEVSQNDTLLLFPSAQGTMLASRVSGVNLQLFAIDLQMLCGVMTVRESKALTAFALTNREKVMLLPANHAFSVRFAEICRVQRPNALLSRLKLLQLFAELLGERFQSQVAAGLESTDGGSRLRELLRHMPEAELMRGSASALAKKLCCSQRHFSRLFHEEVGVSLREKQQQLRLDRARDLLENSAERILNIASEVGYRSLSLFNVMFKRRFDMTPSELRRRAHAARRPSEKVRLSTMTAQVAPAGKTTGPSFASPAR